VTRNLPRPRSLDPDLTDWDPEDMDTWDERIVMVADDEDFLEWQRDWLTDNVARDPEVLRGSTLADRVPASVPGRMVRLAAVATVAAAMALGISWISR
jgi:hypothetical protein